MIEKTKYFCAKLKRAARFHDICASLDIQLHTYMKEILSGITGDHIISVENTAGGCISEAYKAEGTHGKYFVKQNAAGFRTNFEAEVKGLDLLASAKILRVPKATKIITQGKHVFLVMELINEGYMAGKFWEELGTGIAALHRNSRASFGFDTANFIGSLPQSNIEHPLWLTFFKEERIWPQLRLAESAGMIGVDLFVQFEKLFMKIEGEMPLEPPALLHGDLWSGNIMADENNSPVLFDPAVYYGHREMDIAMSKLFSGFDKRFYDAYNEYFPMHGDWHRRMELYNLYPLLVHANLFGAGYLGQVNTILRHWV